MPGEQPEKSLEAVCADARTFAELIDQKPTAALLLLEAGNVAAYGLNPQAAYALIVLKAERGLYEKGGSSTTPGSVQEARALTDLEQRMVGYLKSKCPGYFGSESSPTPSQ